MIKNTFATSVSIIFPITLHISEAKNILHLTCCDCFSPLQYSLHNLSADTYWIKALKSNHIEKYYDKHLL